MNVSIAEEGDLTDLARLLWLHSAPSEQARQSVESFAADLAAWWIEHDDSHHAFVARLAGSEVVGMAWLAFVLRVPRPGMVTRRSADIQSLFVAYQRGKRVGSALVEAALAYAIHRGAEHVTVHSSRKAVPVYERKVSRPTGRFCFEW